MEIPADGIGTIALQREAEDESEVVALSKRVFASNFKLDRRDRPDRRSIPSMRIRRVKGRSFWSCGACGDRRVSFIKAALARME